MSETVLSTDCFGNLILFAFSFIFCIFLAPNSLLYYAVKYDISEEQLQTFVWQLKFPHTVLTLNRNSAMFITVNRILENFDDLKQRSLFRIQFDRLPLAFWPAIASVATFYRLTLPNQLLVDNILTALLIFYGFLIAWRFGSNLHRYK